MHKAAPYFFVDFRKKLSTNPRVRYTDRYYPDGTWEPNLFQFYNRVYRNLDQDIPHPFKLARQLVPMVIERHHQGSAENDEYSCSAPSFTWKEEAGGPCRKDNRQNSDILRQERPSYLLVFHS